MASKQLILICDDQHIIHETLGVYLKSEGFEYVSAYDGDQAIEEFNRKKPNLIILDLMMPKRSGMDVCRTVRQSSNIPIIMLTAKSEEIDRVLGLELGADDYIVKPFDLERIGKTLGRIRDFSESRPVSELSESAKDEKLLIKGKEEINLVDLKDILMVERIDGMCRIVTKDEIFLTSQSLGALEEKLKGDRFLRCHKSYIIRTDAIKKLEVYGRWTYTVHLKDTEETALMTAEKYEEIKQKFF